MAKERKLEETWWGMARVVDTDQVPDRHKAEKIKFAKDFEKKRKKTH